MDSRSESSERRPDGTDSGIPLLFSNHQAAQETEHSQSELVPSNSTGSSSDGHSSNSLKAAFLTPPSPQARRSRLHSFYGAVLHEPYHASQPSRQILEQSFTLPQLSRSRPLKKHSPLNPASLPDLPPKLRTRPGINPLTPVRYRTGSPSSNSSGSRVTFLAYREENVLFPRGQSYTPRSSTTSTTSLTLASDAKYSTVLFSQGRGFVPFPLDLSLIDDDDDDEDMTPNLNEKVVEVGNYSISWRGLSNLVTIVLLVGAIIALFIIYPICSFYHYSCEITAPNIANTSTNATGTNGQGQANVNARELSYYPNYIDSTTPSSALTIKDTDGIEYDLTFSEEWGRHFMQDRIWVVSSNRHSNTTATNGYLLLDSHAHLRTRTFHCLEYGFIEVSFVTEERQWTAFWTGNWTFAQENDLSVVPKGQSLQQMLRVVLHIDYDGDHPSTTSIDHVRLYSLKTHPNLLSCEDASLIHLSLLLP